MLQFVVGNVMYCLY